jgi:hypothetical protein
VAEQRVGQKGSECSRRGQAEIDVTAAAGIVTPTEIFLKLTACFFRHQFNQCKAQVYNGAMITLITKPEIASSQLRTALQHFCRSEYVSAITLAGAAEEILGKLVKSAGMRNALEEDISFMNARLHARGCAIPRKQLITWMNRPRDELKHIGKNHSDVLAIDALEAAEDMIERAVYNYLHVFGEWPDFDGAYEMYYRARCNGQG